LPRILNDLPGAVNFAAGSLQFPITSVFPNRLLMVDGLFGALVK
jgi:hypothetical protein